MQNEIVTFEQATSLTGKKALEFFSNEENIRPLIEQVKTEALSLVPNLKTKAGRDEIGSTALKVSKSRKVLEDAIAASVADLKAKVTAANEVKKTVIIELNDVREQVLAPRVEWQKEQDRIEEIRVNEIKGRIENIRSLGSYQESSSKEQIGEMIEALDLIDVSSGFAEFAEESAKAISDNIKSLNARIIVLIEKEQAEEQRKQLEAEQKKNRIQDRLSNLVQIPLGLMGKNSTDIQSKINSLQAFDVLEEDFEDRAEEAKNSLSQVLSQLDMMLNQANQLEEAKAKAQAEEQAKRDQEEAERAANAVELNKQLPEDSPVKYDEVVHPADCKGCPDCQGINCEVTNSACKEELESHQGRSQTMRNAESGEDELSEVKNLLKQVMQGYQIAASIAEMEGYETRYSQDAILVNLMLNN
jgi:colicin import membrane protein